MTKQEAMTRLRGMLNQLFNNKYQGTHGYTYARNQGLVDGYMRALVDLAVADDDELLEIIKQERSLGREQADLAVTATSTVESAMNLA